MMSRPVSAGPPAPGGAPLVAAIETTQLVVSGRVDGVTHIDAHGYAANLRIERTLRGQANVGNVLRIAWEELAKGRPTRLSDGQQVIVALEPLPTQSLWRTRFPSGTVLVIASRGTAFQPDPDRATSALLARLADLEPEEWSDTTGVAVLAEIAARAQPRIAAGAVARLGQVKNLAAVFDATARDELAQLIGSNDATERVRREAIQLAGDAVLPGLCDALTKLAAARGALEPEAWQALAQLGDGLSAEDVATLLGREDGALRAVAVSQARGTPSEKQVAALITADPSPEVRSAAVEAWLAWHGGSGVGAGEPALFDPDRQVRGHAARAIGGVGDEVVPRLIELLEGRTVEDALGPVAALSLAGPKGHAALQGLVATHPDEKVRKLIRFALGQRIDAH